jgi:formate dehydrogenase beta subunit
MLPLRVLERPVLAYDAVPRVAVPAVPTSRRIGVPEVELGYSEEEARLEAARCLQCFQNIELDVDRCILCGGCVDVCPEKVIRIVSVGRIEGLDEAEPASALVLQEDFCIRCGLCIERCPTNALSFGAWSERSSGFHAIEMVRVGEAS